MSAHIEQMYALLEVLRLAMLEVGWWGERAPDAEALASTEPFCVDTLRFTEWLQWVYMPKMQAYIKQHQALPERSGLFAIAEESWRGSDENTEGLLLVVRTLDALVNGDVDIKQHMANVAVRYRQH
ncbi:MAG: YqcC family protein [Cardiobacteriaceae bacterium]|nr:YqcC family protein [Cardiobacteriaceae bacterium]